MTSGGPDQARQAFDASRLERDRTLRAVHSLETALGTAAETESWLEDVKTDLGVLERAMTDEQRELNRPDALLAMIASEHPRRFGSRIRSLREQYDDIIRQVSSIRRQLEDADSGDHGANDLRHRVGAVIRALHHCRGRQADLVYDALRLDLGERDG